MEVLSPYEPAPAPRRARWWALAWVALAGAITAGGLVAASHASSAPDDLAVIRQFVADHPSHRTSSTSGDLRLETEQASRFEVHTTSVIGDQQVEVIQLGRVTYTRSGTDRWVRVEQPEGSQAEGGVGSARTGWFNYAPNVGISVSTTADAPDIDELAGVDLERDGPTRLVGHYRLRDLAGDFHQVDDDVLDSPARKALDRYLDTEVDVTIEHTGPRLDAITTVTHGDDGDTTAVTRYRDWGAAITVVAPTDVDPTPTIDEEDLAAYQHGPVLVPTDLPDGWTLAVGFVDGGDDCPTATLDFVVDDLGIVGEVVLVPRACTDFDPQEPDDYASTDGATPAVAVKEVPQGWVVVAGPDDATVQRMLASLVPYDSAAMASATVKAPS